MKKIKYSRITCLLLGMLVLMLSGTLAAQAQQTESAEPGPQLIAPEEGVEQSETVTINVKDANISEVLKAYSLQTGQSIVVGPDVVSENVNVRLNEIPWQEALDVIRLSRSRRHHCGEQAGKHCTGGRHRAALLQSIQSQIPGCL